MKYSGIFNEQKFMMFMEIQASLVAVVTLPYLSGSGRTFNVISILNRFSEIKNFQD